MSVSFLDSETTGSGSGVGTRLWVGLPASGVAGRQRDSVRAGSGGGCAGVFGGLAVPHPNSLPMSTHSAPLHWTLAVPITAIFLLLPESVTYIDTDHAFMWMYMTLFTSCCIRKDFQTYWSGCKLIFFTVILLFYVRAIFVSTKVKIVIVYLNAFSFVSSSVVKLQQNFLPLSVCQRLYILELLIWVPQSLIYQINQFNGNFG